MPSTLEYLMKLSVGLAVVGLFYYWVLRRQTFYNWNRWYLLVYAALAFALPLVNLNQTVSRSSLTQAPILRYVPTLPSLDVAEVPQPAMPAEFVESEMVSKLPITVGDWLLILLATGMVVMLVRLGVQLIYYHRIKKQAALVSEGEAAVYHVDRNILPFSFGKAIFVNPALHQLHELREIMAHELVHVRQRHTADILFAELLCVLNWYNPAAWLIRHAIRQNLEFIADRAVLADGTDAQEYQYLLLKVAGVPEFRLANQFNFSSLKERIIMMNRSRSARWYLVRFLYLLPVTVVLLATFRTDIAALAQVKQLPKSPQTTQNSQYVYISGILADGATGKPLPNIQLEKSRRVAVFLEGQTLPERKNMGTLRTDSDGFYYWKIDTKDQEEERVNYTLNYKIGEIDFFAGEFSFKRGNNPLFNRPKIDFLTPGLMDRLRIDWYYVNLSEAIEKDGESALDPAVVKQRLLKELPIFAAEHQLKIDFKKEHWHPQKTITKFRNAYFNQERELIGYEASTKIYLNGKPVSYQKINETFAREPYQIARTVGGLRHQIGMKGEVFYTTFDNYQDVPPVGLATPENVEWLHPDDLDLARLKDEPYMLDGFRMTYGTSSNLMPLREEITRVAIFKGPLARYYDRTLDKLWWIETRPPAEVQGRPAFVVK